MSSGIDRRRHSYRFILDKIRRPEAEFSCKINKSGEAVDTVPLAELDKLKRGIADLSKELVAVLKKLLYPLVTESEIEDELLKPFQLKNPSIG